MVRNAAPAEAVTPIVRSIKERHPSQEAPQLRSQLRSAQAELVKEMMTAMATASSPSSPMPPPLLGSIVAQSKSLAQISELQRLEATVKRVRDGISSRMASQPRQLHRARQLGALQLLLQQKRPQPSLPATPHRRGAGGDERVGTPLSAALQTAGPVVRAAAPGLVSLVPLSVALPSPPAAAPPPASARSPTPIADAYYASAEDVGSPVSVAAAAYGRHLVLGRALTQWMLSSHLHVSAKLTACRHGVASTDYHRRFWSVSGATARARLTACLTDWREYALGRARLAQCAEVVERHAMLRAALRIWAGPALPSQQRLHWEWSGCTAGVLQARAAACGVDIGVGGGEAGGQTARKPTTNPKLQTDASSDQPAGCLDSAAASSSSSSSAASSSSSSSSSSAASSAASPVQVAQVRKELQQHKERMRQRWRPDGGGGDGGGGGNGAEHETAEQQEHRAQGAAAAGWAEAAAAEAKAEAVAVAEAEAHAASYAASHEARLDAAAAAWAKRAAELAARQAAKDALMAARRAAGHDDAAGEGGEPLVASLAVGGTQQRPHGKAREGAAAATPPPVGWGTVCADLGHLIGSPLVQFMESLMSGELARGAAAHVGRAASDATGRCAGAASAATQRCLSTLPCVVQVHERGFTVEWRDS